MSHFRSRILFVLVFVLVSVGAVSSWAQVSTNPTSVSFGNVAVGSLSSPQTVNVTVGAGTTLGEVSAVTQGAANAEYSVRTGTTCSAGTTSSSCTVKLKFQPQAPGSRPGALVFSDGSGNVISTVPLFGVGTGPTVAFGPGIMSTVIGGTVAGTTTGLSYPNGVGVDAAGNVYAASTYNSVVYKLSSSGITTRIAGGNGQGYSGDGGPATDSKLYYPTTVRLDGAANIYIVDDGNNAVRMINSAGIITTIAGLAPGVSICAQATDQWGDGCPATQASLDFFDSYYGEGGTATDAAGNLYIGDTAHNLIRKVGPDGTISIFAGTGVAGYSGDGGPATSAQLNNPDGGAFDSMGNFYIADLYNNVIRMITPGGTISTVAGTGAYGHTGDGGPATSAELGFPYQVAVDAAGDLYITDSGNFTEGDTNEVIRMVTPAGIINTVAGSAPSPNAMGVTYAGDGGPATSALMWGPVDVAVDGKGNLYIADDYNHAIRKVDLSDAPTLSFASTVINSVSAPQDAAIENLGNANLTIVPPYKIGGSFTINDPSTTCAIGGQSLAPATSCILGIEFAPKSYGAHDSGLTVTDNQLNVSASTQTITLQGTAPAPTTIMIATSGSPVDITQPVTFTASVSSAYGSVPDGEFITFKDATDNVVLGMVPLSGGVAMFTTSSLATGTYSIKAKYAGDASFLSSTAGLTQVVQLYPTTTSLTSAQNPSNYAQPITLTATVTSGGPEPTGSVTFYNGANLIATVPVNGSGVAVCVTPLLPTGTDAITAQYGSDQYDASSQSAVLNQTVNPTSTQTGLSSSANPSTAGQTVTFTATVSDPYGGIPTGTVTFLQNGITVGTVPLSGFQASLSRVFNSSGTKSITAVYSGDTHYTTSTSPVLMQMVN